MSTILVVGLGEVGVRAARQLLDTPSIERVLVSSRDREHTRAVADALADGAETLDFSLDEPLPSGVDAIASALPDGAEARLARRALDAGIPIASVAEHDAARHTLAELDDEARRAGTRVVAGCGLAPGLGDVLARHAAAALEAVDEVHVARWGAAGPACIASGRRAQREPALEWRDGALVHDRHHSAELVWFPDPVGARECELVATGIELLVAATPGVGRATVRLGVPASRRFGATAFARRDVGDVWGAVRVEAWGWQGDVRTSVVYGVIERTAVAAGTVLAVTAASLAGALPAVGQDIGPGASGLGTAVKPAPFLAELAHRGVKAAAFEGVAVA